jgi:hypothetical protein
MRKTFLSNVLPVVNKLISPVAVKCSHRRAPGAEYPRLTPALDSSMDAVGKTTEKTVSKSMVAGGLGKGWVHGASLLLETDGALLLEEVDGVLLEETKPLEEEVPSCDDELGVLDEKWFWLEVGVGSLLEDVGITEEELVAMEEF